MILKLIKKLFEPRADKYALAKPEGGGVAYPHINKKLEDRYLIEAISKPNKSLGIFLETNNQTRAGCIDLDTPRDGFTLEECLEVSERLKRVAESVNLTLHTEFSAGKGFHPWLFLDTPIPSDQMRSLLRGIARGAGIEAEEVFPNLSPETKCIKLPGSTNLKTGKVDLTSHINYVAKVHPIPAPIALRALKTPGADKTINQTPNTSQNVKNEGLNFTPACIEHLKQFGAPEGLTYNETNVLLSRFAISRGLEDAEAVSFAEAVAAKSEGKGFNKTYFERVSNFKSVYKSAQNHPQNYQFSCSYVLAKLDGKPPSSRGCIGDKCPLYSLTPAPKQSGGYPLTRLIFEAISQLTEARKEVIKSRIATEVGKKLQGLTQSPSSGSKISELKEKEVIKYFLTTPETILDFSHISTLGFISTHTDVLALLDEIEGLQLISEVTLGEYLAEVHLRGVEVELEKHKTEINPQRLDELYKVANRAKNLLERAAITDKYKSQHDLQAELFEELFENTQNSLPTPFSHLNKLLGGGFKAGKLYILSAPPANGKSTFCAQISDFLAIRKYRVLYVSFEMSRVQFFLNSLSRISKINSQKIDSKESFSRIKELGTALEKYHNYSEFLLIVEGDYLFDMRALQGAINQIKPDIVFIDYLQFMSTGVEKIDNNEVIRVSNVATGLKTLAISSGIPIVAISDMSKDSFKKLQAGKNPDLGDNRDSFKISHAADVAMVLLTSKAEAMDQLAVYQYYFPEREKQIMKLRNNYPISEELNETWGRLVITKNRGGRLGQPLFKYSRAIHTFLNIELEGNQNEF